MDWRRWRQSTAYGQQSRLLTALDGAPSGTPSDPTGDTAEGADGGPRVDLAQRLLLLDDPAARQALVEDEILGAVARVLGLDRSRLDQGGLSICWG